jgi:hypothetical protein
MGCSDWFGRARIVSQDFVLRRTPLRILVSMSEIRPSRRPPLSFSSRAILVSSAVLNRRKISATSREIAALPLRNKRPV